jgi:hypothetical protein
MQAHSRECVSNKHAVIDVTTSQSTTPASWQVAGYPAKAGIQMIVTTPRKWDNIKTLSASQRIFLTGFRPSPE